MSSHVGGWWYVCILMMLQHRRGSHKGGPGEGLPQEDLSVRVVLVECRCATSKFSTVLVLFV